MPRQRKSDTSSPRAGPGPEACDVAPTHPELARLLAGLNGGPDDHALWLVIADWLEEHGQPERAELTRLTRTLQASGPPSGGRVSHGRATTEDRIRVLIAGGVRPCVPEVTNSIGMRFALIPPGTFWMGSPEDEEGRLDNETRHQVTLTRAFWLGVHPVTQAQYEALMRSNPSYFSKKGDGKAEVKKLDTSSFPVDQVSWDDAAAFCDRLSAFEGEKATGRLYRLPTEAEWEYACRGGIASGAFHFGDTLDKTQANFDEKGVGRTRAVGAYPPNAFGLFDMHGQVWEWCFDWASDYPAKPATDPTGPEEGAGRMIRGGCWYMEGEGCRTASRCSSVSTYRSFDHGFRVAFYPTP